MQALGNAATQASSRPCTALRTQRAAAVRLAAPRRGVFSSAPPSKLTVMRNASSDGTHTTFNADRNIVSLDDSFKFYKVEAIIRPWRLDYVLKVERRGTCVPLHHINRRVPAQGPPPPRPDRRLIARPYPSSPPQALDQEGIRGLTAQAVGGIGVQGGTTERSQGSEYGGARLVDKYKIEIVTVREQARERAGGVRPSVVVAGPALFLQMSIFPPAPPSSPPPPTHKYTFTHTNTLGSPHRR